MPNRRFADLLSDLLKFGAIVYFLIQVALFILAFAARRNVDLGGIVSAVVLAVIIFTLGVLLDVLLGIERGIYELLAALKRPRN